MFADKEHDYHEQTRDGKAEMISDIVLDFRAAALGAMRDEDSEHFQPTFAFEVDTRERAAIRKFIPEETSTLGVAR